MKIGHLRSQPSRVSPPDRMRRLPPWAFRHRASRGHRHARRQTKLSRTVPQGKLIQVSSPLSQSTQRGMDGRSRRHSAQVAGLAGCGGKYRLAESDWRGWGGWLSCANRASRGAVERAERIVVVTGKKGECYRLCHWSVVSAIDWGHLGSAANSALGRAGGGAWISGVSLFGWRFSILKIGNFNWIFKLKIIVNFLLRSTQTINCV